MEDAHHQGGDHRDGTQADGHQEGNSSVLAGRFWGVTARDEATVIARAKLLENVFGAVLRQISIKNRW